MYQVDNKKFGKFLSEMRKEKNMTQKELAEKLFVSDKTVSKWECGNSMPNVVLLIPIADTLGVTVTELLKGEKIDQEKDFNPKEVESLVVGSLDLSMNHFLHRNKKKWILAYILCVLITLLEIGFLLLSGFTLSQMGDDILLVCGLFLLFSGWFCLFAKEVLPDYYDKNKIHYVSQGIFRFNMVGLSFHNGNWPYICTACKGSMMIMAVLYPLICYGSLLVGGMTFWNGMKKIVTIIMMVVLVGTIYVVGKKYE